MKLKVIIIFCLSFMSLSSWAKYSLNSKIDSKELSYIIAYLQKNDSKLLEQYIGPINNWAINMELTNLELVIKTEFYKSFLNDSADQDVDAKNITNGQLNTLTQKITNKPEDFSTWFIKNLLDDYSNSTKVQREYMTPWLLTYLEVNPNAWRKKIKASMMNYLENLKTHLQLSSLYARSDRTASQTLNQEALIVWNQLPKSKAIDLIDKNLPKAP